MRGSPHQLTACAVRWFAARGPRDHSFPNRVGGTRARRHLARLTMTWMGMAAAQRQGCDDATMRQRDVGAAAQRQGCDDATMRQRDVGAQPWQMDTCGRAVSPHGCARPCNPACGFRVNAKAQRSFTRLALPNHLVVCQATSLEPWASRLPNRQDE